MTDIGLMPEHKTAKKESPAVDAVRGVLASIMSMIEGGATHIGVATDHVVESFRNELYPGLVVWPMVYFQADDALASAAEKASMDDRLAVKAGHLKS